LDAVYCGAAGVLAVVLAAPLGKLFEIPTAVLWVAGVATVGWALLLAVLARREQWWSPLLLVGAANTLAAAAIAVSALVVAAPGARLLLVAVAVEVAGFAAVQFGLLRD
jgi:hypothetical protein